MAQASMRSGSGTGPTALAQLSIKACSAGVIGPSARAPGDPGPQEKAIVPDSRVSASGRVVVASIAVLQHRFVAFTSRFGWPA